MVILLIFYIFYSSFTLTTTWCSLLNENIVGESFVNLQIFYKLFLFSYWYIFEGINCFHTCFTLRLMFSFTLCPAVFNVIQIVRLQSTTGTRTFPCTHSRCFSFFKFLSKYWYFPLCIVPMCFPRLWRIENLFPHTSHYITLFSSPCTLSMCLFSFIITQNCWNLVNCHDKIIVHIDSSYFQTSSWPFVSYLQISNFGTFSSRTSPYYQQQQIDIWFWNWDI